MHFVLLGQILLLHDRHRCQWIHSQTWYLSIFFMSTSESMLVLLGLCQVTRLLHFRHGFVDFVPFDFLFSVATLNSHSRDSVVPQLLTHHSVYVGTCTSGRSRVRDLCRARVFIRYCKLPLDNHWLYWWCRWRLWYWYRRRSWRWYRWRLWCLCKRMHTITRSRPLPLFSFLW